MLQLIFGKSGTGKTTMLRSRLEEGLCRGEQSMLLVPEQSSFVNEQRLTAHLGLETALKCDVLSFSRLARQVFTRLGGLAGVHLEPAAKTALISVVLEQLQDTLELFRSSITQSSFAEQMRTILQEFVSAGVSGELLRQFSKTCDRPDEARKLYELSLILEGYQSVLEQGYSDPHEELFRACKILENRNYFQGIHVYVDGFVSFSNGEWKLLEYICAGSENLTVTLCCEKVYEQSGISPFTAAQTTARRLISLARRQGVDIKAPVVLTEPHRFKTAGLRHLAVHFGETHPPVCRQSDGVQVFSCKDKISEVQTAAKQICALVREGYRYREIAVVCRNLEDYDTALRTVFPRYGIPVFLGDREQVGSFPLVRGILSALKSVESGFATEHLLQLMKSGLMSFEDTEAAALENYVYLWKLTGKAWTTPFVGHPSGLRSKPDSERQAKIAKNRLERLNHTRETLMTPLLTLQKRLKKANGKGVATAIYQYLEDVQARESLLSFCEEMDVQERKRFLDVGAQVWDQVMKSLDVLGGPLANSVYELPRFRGLLELCFGQIQVSTAPQTQDQVFAGSADTARPNRVRAVFVLGVNQDVFPGASGSGGILTEKMRDTFVQEGYPLLITAAQKMSMEQFYLYFALTQAQERLYLTFSRQTLKGEGRRISAEGQQVLDLFGKCVLQEDISLADALSLCGKDSAYDELCRRWREETPFAMGLRTYFAKTLPEELQALEERSEKAPYRLKTEEGKQLFAGEMMLSPSRLEQYYSCPFSYFCQGGLKLFPRTAAEYNMMESGKLLHAVLEEMVRRYGNRLGTLTSAQLSAESAEIIERELRLGAGDVSLLTSREQYLFRRQQAIAVAALTRLGGEFAQSGYVPAAVELAVGREGCPAWQLPGQVQVSGIVDRLDVFETADKRYLRVVDYKTGLKQFRLEEVVGGLNMQMLIYLFTLQDHYSHKLDNIPSAKEQFLTGERKNLPAGVLYMPTRLGNVSAARGEDISSVLAQRDKGLRMNGLLLNHMESLTAMERDLGGKFIPTKLKKDGTLSQTGLPPVSENAMNQLRNIIGSNITSMAEHLRAGEIPALPVEKIGDQPGESSVCGYCQYGDICMREVHDHTRILPDAPDFSKGEAE